MISLKRQKIFITGGAGFIGSHLVDKLMVSKAQVSVYDNLSSGKKEFIKHHLTNSRFRFIQADVLDLKKLKQTIKGHNLVFHLAANPDIRNSLTNTRLDLEQETIATYNVLEAMRQNKINRIVFSSSGTVYGETPIKPIKEDYGPILPISLYGAGKVAGEALISAFCGIFDFQAWIFRFANVIGPRATHGVIFDFINKLKKNPRQLEILGNGQQSKPYIFVKDCINGILFGLIKANNKINLFNLGVSGSTSVNQIAQMLIAEIGLSQVKISYTGGDRGWPGDVPQYRCNTSKLKNLGWQAEFSSNQAIKKTIQCLLKSQS